VWGVCGERGFPGDEDWEKAVDGTIPGTLLRFRLDVDGEELEGCSSRDEDMESASALWESLIFWNLDKGLLMTLLLDSPPPLPPKLFRLFFCPSANIDMKSRIWMSSS
jgi:hypothetical protein